MPTDLDRMFNALASDAGAARLDPAATVRRRADRRLAIRSVAGAAAVAVLVAGAVTGTRLVLTAQDAGPLVPNPPAQSGPVVAPPSVAPSTSSLPSSAPPPTEPSKTPPSSDAPAAPTIPKSIPDRAFLQTADWPGKLQDRSPQDFWSPELCGADFTGGDRIGVRDTISYIYRHKGEPDDYVPTGMVYNTVAVFRGDGAERLLDELRAKARSCERATLLGPVDAGDESVLMELSEPATSDAGDPIEGEQLSYLGAVRAGDAVALISVNGWESSSAERSAGEAFTRGAGERVAAWRG